MFFNSYNRGEGIEPWTSLLETLEGTNWATRPLAPLPHVILRQHSCYTSSSGSIRWYHCQNTSERITYHFELSDATSNKYDINVQKQVINSMKHRHGHWHVMGMTQWHGNF